MRRSRTVFALAPADVLAAVRGETHVESDQFSGCGHGVQEISAASDV